MKMGCVLTYIHHLIPKSGRIRIAICCLLMVVVMQFFFKFNGLVPKIPHGRTVLFGGIFGLDIVTPERIAVDRSNRSGQLLNGANYKDFPNITLMVRTSSKPALLGRFYCMYLRTALLFWPTMYGSMVVILDEESPEDHKFGGIFQTQMNQHFPQVPIKIHYEPLPENKEILTFKESPRTPTYNRQLWSTFFADVYSDEEIIAYMDTDIQFQTPITKQFLFHGKRLKVFGDSIQTDFVRAWNKTTVAALGIPMVSNFMITFPQLIYRNTYIRCRKFIMQRFNTNNFEVAFKKFYLDHTRMCPICIIMTYAWYFEKNRYDWHIKSKIVARENKHLPKNHQIQPEDIMPSIVPISHMNADKKWQAKLVVPGYCRSLQALGSPLPACKSIKHDISLFCTFWEPVHRYPWPNAKAWCGDSNINICCKKAMDEHYQNVAEMGKQNVISVRKENAELAECFAKQMGVKCPDLILP